MSTAGDRGDPRPGCPAVSVLMAVCDGERFVAEAVESILSQSFTDLELIVVDDGSVDATFEILETYSDARVRIVRQSNAGLTLSLIRAAGMARGRYLARQDSDDVSKPVRIERQVKYLETHPDTALLGTSATLINEFGEEFGRVVVEDDPESIVEKLNEENQFVHGSILMRSEAYREVGGYRKEFLYAQDYDLVARIAERWKVANLKETYYGRRITTDMVSFRYNSMQAGFRDLARTFRAERLETGSDRLERQSAVEELDDIARLREDKDYLERHRAMYIYTCLRHGNTARARRAITEEIRDRPVQWRSYAHYILTFLGGAAVARLLRSWDAWRVDREHQ